MFVRFTFSFEPEPNKTESVAKEVSPRAKKVTEVSPQTYSRRVGQRHFTAEF